MMITERVFEEIAYADSLEEAREIAKAITEAAQQAVQFVALSSTRREK